MQLGLKGRWALVSGASKGLGYGCARALALEGVNVVLVARGPEALREAASSIRREAGPATEIHEVAVDITSKDGIERVLAFRRDYDILVTNAAGPPTGDFRDWDRDTWLEAINANMLTPIGLIQACIAGMAARGFGRVVNITSSSVKAPIDILGLSNGARSGLTGFIAGVARSPEFAARNVTVNNLLPGSFATDRLMGTIQTWARLGGKAYDLSVQERIDGIPARRFGTPEEFGAVCAFLCSAQAGYITGQNVLIDGGAYPGTF